MTFDLSNLKIEKTVVQAKSRSLNATWTVERELTEKEWNELQQKEYEVLAEVADTPDVYNHMLCLLGLSYSDYLAKIDKEKEVYHEIGEELEKMFQEEIDKEILASIVTKR